ncbi:MAG: carbon storage regulator [Marinobacterium sp.]|nr:carbon storage regulator [Marinobacterium sp.]
MLLITAYQSETTTISTPTGDVLSVAVLGYSQNQFSLGINAPQEYIILRHKLRERIIKAIQHSPVFFVTSASHHSWVIAAKTDAHALQCYQQKNPGCKGVEVQWVEKPQYESWFERLVSVWPAHSGLPVAVKLV